eukprot:COSAG01_NODE_5942_length_3938_cov_6.444300_5_plen_70_part_01
MAGWVNGTAAMAASPQHRAMSAVLSAPRGHPLRPTNAQLISVLWRFVREWRGGKGTQSTWSMWVLGHALC